MNKYIFIYIRVCVCVIYRFHEFTSRRKLKSLSKGGGTVGLILLNDVKMMIVVMMIIIIIIGTTMERFRAFTCVFENVHQPGYHPIVPLPIISVRIFDRCCGK